MSEGESESTRRLLEELKKPRVLRFLLSLARRRTGDRTLAEDLVADAIVRAMDPDDLPWDGTRRFASFMSFSFRRIYRNQMRRLSGQEAALDTEVLDETTESALPRPDEDVDRARSRCDHEAIFERVCVDLGRQDPRLRQCFELMADEVSAEDQCAILGWSIEDVYREHRTIRRRALAIHAEWLAEQEAAMAVRRQANPVTKEAEQ
jgi:DNA-directed RNA polymerase specialized sigma24 family protein